MDIPTNSRPFNQIPDETWREAAGKANMLHEAQRRQREAVMQGVVDVPPHVVTMLEGRELHL